MSGTGEFIVIEGIDAAGTTTQTKKITETLNKKYEDQGNYPTPVCHATKEPTNGPIGSTIRTALTNRLEIDDTTLALLFAADRTDHNNTKIKPLLEEGHLVISDRYYHSSFAYQQTIDEIELDWVRSINKKAQIPDLTIYIDISVGESLKRMNEKRADISQEKFEKRSQLKRIRQNYQTIIEHLRDSGESIVTIDGEQPISDVHDKIIEAIESNLSL